MPDFDPRVTPARADLAAMSLQGRIAAPRYAEGRVYEVVAAQAPLRRAPRPDAPLETEALKGERMTVYDWDGEGWAWGQLQSDKYVGFLPQSALGPPGPPPTHKVVALRSFAFPGPSIKLPPLEAPPFGSRLAVARTEERLAVTAAGAFVPLIHLAPVGEMATDFVAVAERFVGVPYLWGGKTALGLDCSGLLQIALTACGVACPRDTDMQEAALGTPAAAADYSNFKRGDLVFWKGHVAIVRDAANFLHANAFHMAVAIEPIAAAIARIEAAGNAIAGVRRLAR